MNNEHHPSYRQLAARLDALPNGFPATDDGLELKLLAKLFTPEEAALAAQLRLTPETPAQLAARIDGDAGDLRQTLKSMAKRGLIAAERTGDGVAYRLLPFVVGIYEMQITRIDAELAQLFEDYYLQAIGPMLAVEPQVHRVIPVNESVGINMEIQPHESVVTLVDRVQAWGVMDCICRKQKALIGDPCHHPVDVCMMFSTVPGAFDHSTSIRALTRDEALVTLRRAAEAGLVHTVSNNQEGVWYICNCCTCSCGILRGIADLGIANVVARSAFVSQVDTDLCTGCEDCLDACQFDALELGEDGIMQVHRLRCVGCGLCTLNCPDGALSLVRRPDHEIKPVPATESDWGAMRAASRGLNLDDVL